MPIGIVIELCSNLCTVSHTCPLKGWCVLYSSLGKAVCLQPVFLQHCRGRQLVPGEHRLFLEATSAAGAVFKPSPRGTPPLDMTYLTTSCNPASRCSAASAPPECCCKGCARSPSGPLRPCRRGRVLQPSNGIPYWVQADMLLASKRESHAPEHCARALLRVSAPKGLARHRPSKASQTGAPS